jgi:hypothetical protein
MRRSALPCRVPPPQQNVVLGEMPQVFWLYARIPFAWQAIASTLHRSLMPTLALLRPPSLHGRRFAHQQRHDGAASATARMCST